MHDKPHLLWASLEGSEVKFNACCPYSTLDRPCALFVECTEHPEPDEPEDEWPPFLWEDGKVVRDDSGEPCFKEEVSSEWKQWRVDHAEWAKLHQFGEEDVYHRVNSCWVEEWVDNDTLGNGWEVYGFPSTVFLGSVPVDWENQGDLDDSKLRLIPWKDESGSEDA